MTFLQPPAALLYPHRLTIFRKTRSRNAAGKPLADTWGTEATAVAAYFETGKSQQAPNGFVLEESDNLFTFDAIHTASGVDLRVDDIVKQTTGPDAGVYWRVRGNAQQRTQFAGKQILLANRTPKPDGVP